jgi:hypothetical protein
MLPVRDSRRWFRRQSGCPINGPRLQDKRPRRTSAFKDAVEQDFEHAQLRLIPWVSSEASGSPALLP